MDIDGNLTTNIYDNRDEFIFSIINFTVWTFITYEAMYLHHPHMEFLSAIKLDTQGHACHINSF